MPYRQQGSMADLLDDAPIDQAARRTTERVGHLLHERVTFHTPVAVLPPGGTIDERDGRRPGTLKDSWKVGEMTVAMDGQGYSIDVYTDDPIAPYVEYPVAPHEIRPRRPDGMLRFRGRDGSVIYAKLVHHPGHFGAFMMATSLAEVAAQWQAIGKEELDRAMREWTRSAPLRRAA